jgi:hypothetical protein
MDIEAYRTQEMGGYSFYCDDGKQTHKVTIPVRPAGSMIGPAISPSLRPIGFCGYPPILQSNRFVRLKKEINPISRSRKSERYLLARKRF